MLGKAQCVNSTEAKVSGFPTMFNGISVDYMIFRSGCVWDPTQCNDQQLAARNELESMSVNLEIRLFI